VDFLTNTKKKRLPFETASGENSEEFLTGWFVGVGRRKLFFADESVSLVSALIFGNDPMSRICNP
ncbi:hypothetical protein, partial [Chryseobacterium sp.]|uniref:hypothetical protein n=1 Tax=Chryseobacterium sp. TaxID=1871047 RepID=UPI002899B23B